MDSRKYRSSSTTETNNVFRIDFRQFARTAMLAAPNNVVASTCDFHNLRQDTAGAMPVACKLWLMPGAKLNKLRAKSATELCHRA
jgi:hypothetical protein